MTQSLERSVPRLAGAQSSCPEPSSPRTKRSFDSIHYLHRGGARSCASSKSAGHQGSGAGLGLSCQLPQSAVGSRRLVVLHGLPAGGLDVLRRTCLSCKARKWGGPPGLAELPSSQTLHSEVLVSDANACWTVHGRCLIADRVAAARLLMSRRSSVHSGRPYSRGTGPSGRGCTRTSGRLEMVPVNTHRHEYRT